MVAHVTAPTAAPLETLPSGVTLLRADNPGPMTLDGTNTWILREPGIVIDPGPLDETHLRAIVEQGPVHLILVTHGHFDHTEGAPRLSRLLGGVPVRGADARYCIRAEPLRDGEELPGGLRVLAIPGHTGDSVAFVADGAVFTGDTILGRGTTVVAWPDGDLGAYLNSLEVLTAYPRLLLPGHGPVRHDCAEAARAYLAHRRERLAQVEAAVAAGAD